MSARVESCVTFFGALDLCRALLVHIDICLFVTRVNDFGNSAKTAKQCEIGSTKERWHVIGCLCGCLNSVGCIRPEHTHMF